VLLTKDQKEILVDLPPITPGGHQNYVAFFLTLACNLRCPYCINLHTLGHGATRARVKRMLVEDWIAAANRLELRDDLPLTLQGGEPTLYPDFFRFVHEVRPDLKMDLMTNLQFDVEEFIASAPAWRFVREAPYAPIRASYHPGQHDIEDLIRKVLKLQDAGFRVGLYAIEHPDTELRSHVLSVKDRCRKLGIDFRTKEYLGEYKGKAYGTVRYPGSVMAGELRMCECKTTEIIVDPAGRVFRCHADLYHSRNPIAHILDPEFSATVPDEFRTCTSFGDCNPCDVKIKTNRFQVFGHTSVEIRNIQ